MKDITWAEQLVGKVLTYEGRLHAPRFKFVFSNNHKWSSGRTFTKPYRGYHIFLRIGTDPKEAKMVLLHEMAHWLLTAGHHHDKAFWKKAWELYFLFQDELDLEAVKVREGNYKQKSTEVYEEYISSGFQPRRISFANSLRPTLTKPSRKKEIKEKVNVRDVRYQQALKMVKKYQTKVKRDQTLLKKWQGKVKYYERSIKA